MLNSMKSILIVAAAIFLAQCAPAMAEAPYVAPDGRTEAQLIAAQSLALNEKEKAKFGALVDSMTKTYKLLDIILVDFLPTEQDLLEIVEENSHLFGNHDFKAPSGGMPDLEKNENDDDDDDHSEAFNNNKKRFLQTHTAEKKSSKRYYSWLKNSQNYNMIPVIRTGK